MPQARIQASGPVGDEIVLEDETARSRVVIAPERGALVTSFCVGGRELLYLDESTLVDRTKNVRGGIPVLFPSPGKLAGDAWHRAGRSGTMKQHGFARNLPWSIGAVSHSAARATLLLTSTDETLSQYPWQFRAALSFVLLGSTLRIAARVGNADSSPMPIALGYHPYFAVHDKARARIASDAKHAFDNVMKRNIVFSGFDFTAPELDLHLLDHGPSACALTLGDGARIEVRGSLDFARWVVWTVGGKDYICLEPWTALGNALNTGEDLLELAPGEERELWVEIDFSHVL